LAREIELAEAEAAVGCVRTTEMLGSKDNLAALSIAGGYAVYCGSGNPVTQAVGLGLCGPVSHPQFDTLEEFYFSRNEPTRVETCPLADASLFTHYKERSYHVSEFSNVMVRSIADLRDSSPLLSNDVEIRLATRAEIELWVMTVAQGFAEHYPVTDEILRVMKLFALGDKTECYLATLDGKIAGGATLALRGRITGLFGASTLPAFRKHGVQTALLRRRLQRAAELKCELAMSLAQPGSASARNITRCGFETLYTRIKFERELPTRSKRSV
jgi:GNAT superfamily N-acetyltransferase